MQSDQFKKGLARRREVLGDEYVDKALEAATPFTTAVQKMVTENAWGGVWSDGVIPDKIKKPDYNSNTGLIKGKQ